MKNNILFMLLVLGFSTFAVAKETLSDSTHGEHFPIEKQMFGKYYSSWVTEGKSKEHVLPDGKVFPGYVDYFAIDKARDLIVYKTVYETPLNTEPYTEAQIKLDDYRVKTSFLLLAIDCKIKYAKNIAKFSMNEKNELINFEALSEYESNQYIEPHKDSITYAIMQKYEICSNR